MRAHGLLLLVPLVASSGCFAAVTGSGVKLTEARKIAAFSKIDVSDGVRLEVSRSSAGASISVEGDDNIVPLYVTEVVGDELRIHRATKEWLRPRVPVVVKVSTPTLTALEASGGVEVVLGVAGPSLALELSGGVELEAKGLELDALSIDASGGAELALSGHVRKARVELSGGVSMKSGQLEVGDLTLDASGGCDVDVGVKESIVAEASGGVGITVHGRPAKSKVHTSAGADVTWAD